MSHHEELTPEDYLNSLKNDIKIDKEVTHEFFTNKEGETIVLDRSNIKSKKPVIYFKGNKSCELEIGRRLNVVKIFIEDCHDCTVTVASPLSTGVVELWKCSNVIVNVNNVVGTMQCDLSTDITLNFQHKKYLGSVVQAGMENLHFIFRDAEEFNFESGLGPLKEQYPDMDLNETHDQFITRWIKKELLTEIIIRMENGYPSTEREVAEMEVNSQSDEYFSRFMEGAAPALGMDESQLIAKSNEAKAEMSEKYKHETQSNLKKLAATKAYVNGNYERAITLLSEAIEIASDNHVLYSNRALAYIATSQYELAIIDCDKVIELDDEFVKGYYRKGLCLVELENWEEAKVAFREAYDLDPENQEIVDQLTLVERKIDFLLDED